jgi:uncharacterized protein YjbJ (UPF0337 family)
LIGEGFVWFSQEGTVSWESIEGDWPRFVGKAKHRWADVTDEEWAMVRGSREAFASRLQERYAIAKDEADRQIDEWMKEPGVLDDWNDRRPILDM